MGRLVHFGRGRVAMLLGVGNEDRVGIGRYVLVRIDRDDSRGSNARVDGVRKETLAKTGNDEVLGDGGQAAKVSDGLELVTH